MSVFALTATDYTLPFSDPACADARETGGKGKGLAEMTQADLPVPPGFTVTASAYRAFLSQGNLRQKIAEILSTVDAAHPVTVDAAATQLTSLLEAQAMPAEVAESVRIAYAELCERIGVDDVSVAVRSSATAEDSVDDSFAGEFETWVDVRGAEDVLAYVHRCYSSVYAARVLQYASERNIALDTVEMAVVVQKVVRARAAGVMFTLDPISGDRARIVLEASYGLGLSVVGGEVTPDRYTVAKVGLSVRDRVLGDKRIEYLDGHGTVEVSEERQAELCLSDVEVVALAAWGKQLEKMHGGPQDIEFAVDSELPEGEHLLLLQCRPETVWTTKEHKPAFDQEAGLMSWVTSSITVPTRAAVKREKRGRKRV